MKKNILILLLSLVLGVNAKAQKLHVPEVIQEYNQWCWSGVSTSILRFYGIEVQQCELAEYTRTHNNWHNFGTQNCCEDPYSGCNYWNIMYDRQGSIQDILQEFGDISSYGMVRALYQDEITEEAQAGRPFVIRWAWKLGGGGHFILGHGIDEYGRIYYMNPWPGEGYHLSEYASVKNDYSHRWTHSVVLETSPSLSSGNEVDKLSMVSLLPNLVKDVLTIETSKNIEHLKVYDVNGKLLCQKNQMSEHFIELSHLKSGIYFIEILFDEDIYVFRKIVKS